MVSRGISQVSAMISATLSKVVDIGALNWAVQAGAVRKGSGAGTARQPLVDLDAPIAKESPQFNAGRGSLPETSGKACTIARLSLTSLRFCFGGPRNSRSRGVFEDHERGRGQKTLRF